MHILCNFYNIFIEYNILIYTFGIFFFQVTLTSIVFMHILCNFYNIFIKYNLLIYTFGRFFSFRWLWRRSCSCTFSATSCGSFSAFSSSFSLVTGFHIYFLVVLSYYLFIIDFIFLSSSQCWSGWLVVSMFVFSLPPCHSRSCPFSIWNQFKDGSCPLHQKVWKKQ